MRLQPSPRLLASAGSASQRGDKDCMAGDYDQNQRGASYKKGCRAAEDKKGAAAPVCPPDVTEADRYRYPGCK